MAIPDSIVGKLPGSQLSLSELFKKLRIQGRLRSLVLEALTDQMVQDEARQAGLSVTPEELQAAADAFRRRHGLSAAAETHAWLAEHGMSVDDLNEYLKQEVLAGKLRQHLTAARIEGHFTIHQEGYERLRLAQVCVGRDDLANELASQVRDDGRDLDAVATEHKIRLERSECLRKDLTSPLVDALASAGTDELVGPVVTQQGFVLAKIEQRSPAVLDAATKQQIGNELFTAWVAERLRDAMINLELGATN